MPKKKTKKKEKEKILTSEEQGRIDLEEATNAIQAIEPELNKVLNRMGILNPNSRVIYFDIVLGNLLNHAHINPLMTIGMLTQISNNISIMIRHQTPQNKEPPSYAG